MLIIFHLTLIIVNKMQIKKQLSPNPYKITNGLEENCIGKAAFSYCAGGAMGFIMAIFMNAVEMREIEIGKIRRSTAIVLRKDARKIMGTAKGFATFGGVFVLFQCMIEHVRQKDDGVNSFLSGMATSMLLGANVMGRKELFYSGLGGGFMCWGFYKVFKMLGY